MDSVRLKISIKDWLYIIIIGALFGFFISLFFYFLNSELKVFSTIIVSTSIAVIISFFAFIFITISNDYILPQVNEKFWYFISFLFSFLSGFLGFTFSYYIFSFSQFQLINLITPYWFYMSITIGFLTFLIGLILHQFISMKYRSESAYSEVLETKIKALENELNPHFLFNALNSISELIYLDQKKAENATLDLSKFLRNAINKESLVLVSSELDMVKTYLDIENIRFDNNIKLHIKNEVEETLIKIPKFSIQLLVENAIKHGFETEALNVEITVKNDKIIVQNNGKLSNDIIYGTGLSNLKRRLELLNIGSLEHKVADSKMVFIINLKG